MRRTMVSLILVVATWRIQVAVELGIAASRRPKPAAEHQAQVFRPMKLPQIPPAK